MINSQEVLNNRLDRLPNQDDLRTAEIRNIRQGLVYLDLIDTRTEKAQEILEVRRRIYFLKENPEHAGKHEEWRDTITP